jgi:hypothetical protein
MATDVGAMQATAAIVATDTAAALVTDIKSTLNK